MKNWLREITFDLIEFVTDNKGYFDEDTEYDYTMSIVEDFDSMEDQESYESVVRRLLGGLLELDGVMWNDEEWGSSRDREVVRSELMKRQTADIWCELDRILDGDLTGLVGVKL